ncbi:PREDICTED: uncharacterized protein LOC105567061 isoform X2 [Vollenhovia emeryi]|nr:PREDICTED: uncharacterized protein LOC105567061 isoform X2 [Vollenhovia emeryi]
MDFESVLVPKTADLKRERCLNIDIRNTVKQIYANLFSLYSWMMQETSVSCEQLSAILNAEALLNDHFSTISDLLAKCNNSSKRVPLQELIVTGAVLVSSMYVSWCEHKTLPTLFASSAICCVGYTKYLRFRANRNLKNVVSLQNELFLTCKDGLKILRRDYKIKLGSETCFQQFSHFLGEKLQYLESLKDSLIRFMENISRVYYECSLSIAKLLPPDALSEESFTKFEADSFEASGEIDYQALKRLYHIYLLVQSEMLYLLAVAYDSSTWIRSCQKIPETKLAHIIHILIKELAVYKIKLSEVINAYRTCKMEPVRYKTQDKVKWHDPTVQLDLASYKLQLAYNQVFSTFKNIEDCINQDIGIDNETADTLMQKLGRAFKEIDTAGSLAEFVVLLMARSGFGDLRSGDRPAVDDTAINQNSDVPIIIDSDPQILDEVFEEYIKDEYLKPLNEDTDECSLEQRKLDKLLAKNFMVELKEALVDKHKSMSERESRALQRVYKNVSRDPTSRIEENEKHVPPVPPPIPLYYIWSTSSSDANSNGRKRISSTCKIKNDESSVRRESSESGEENDLVKPLKRKNILDTSRAEVYDGDEESVASLPQILLETRATRFVTKLPPPFLREETFVGSGENSEDEIVGDASDCEEDRESQ